MLSVSFTHATSKTTRFLLGLMISILLSACSGGGGGGGSTGSTTQTVSGIQNITVSGMQGGTLRFRLDCSDGTTGVTAFTTLSTGQDGTIPVPQTLPDMNGVAVNCTGTHAMPMPPGIPPSIQPNATIYIYTTPGLDPTTNTYFASGMPDGQNCTVGATGGIGNGAITCTVTGTAVSPANQGKWRYADTGVQIALSQFTSRNLTTIDNNLLRETAPAGTSSNNPCSACVDTSTYYLIREGISNVATSGSVSTSASNGGTADLPATTSLVGLNVKLTDKLDRSKKFNTTTVFNGRFNVSIPTGKYDIEISDPINTTSKIASEVEVQDVAKDVGDLTLVSPTLHNFKTEITYGNASPAVPMTGIYPPDNDWLYFGTLAGQDPITYNKTLVVTNIGAANVSGASFVVSSADPDVSSLVATNIVGGMAPGAALTIPVSFTFNRPSLDKDVIFNVAITDINGHKWNNRVTLRLSSHVPVTVNLGANPAAAANPLQNNSANGLIVTPGRTLRRISSGAYFGMGAVSSIRLPYIVGDVYEIAMSNPDITKEAAYSIGFGVPADSAGFASFTNTAIHEPTDNVFAGATALTLGQSDISYVSTGDIDYYKLTFDALNVPFDPRVMGRLNGPFNFPLLDVHSPIVIGNYAYLKSATSLIVADVVTNPATPAIIGTLAIPGIRGIAVIGTTAYVTDGSNLKIVDVANPAAPAITGSVVINAVAGGSANSVAISGAYAYVMDGINLTVVNIANPAAPMIAATLPIKPVGGVPGAGMIAISGTTAYVTDRVSSLTAVNIATPTAPVISATIATNSAPHQLAISGNYVYVQTGVGADIVNFTVPTGPVIAGNVPVSGAVAVNGSYLYMCGGVQGGAKFFDISVPASPKLMGSIGGTPLGGGVCTSLSTNGNSAYTTDDWGNLNIIKLK